MFIYTVRAHTVRLAAVVCLAVVMLLGLAIVADADVSFDGAVETISYSKIKNDGDRMSFLKSLGWETTGGVIEEEQFTLPETFDRVLLGYNEVQRDQGLDLSHYRGKRVTRYTYEITNYPDYEGKVYANLIVYRNKIIAGDISSADPMGFVRGFQKPATQ